MSEGDIPTLIGFIDQSANRLIDIVNDFLNVSRIEQGRMTFNIEPFPIAELIAEVIQEIKSLAEQKNIFLTFENKNQSLRLTLADRDRTKQVLVNLIGNAIKFTETGGVTVNVEEKDHYTTVRVKDTGTGISQANQKFLFRKFKQADENILAHDSNRGTGLGLYISKKFVENMGGMIYLESSEENKGSTFVFSLPRLEPKI
jgi:signal transduction histidine kinase